MSTLGFGTRVWVGWCPDDMASDTTRSARCRKGTICEGPRHLVPGERIFLAGGSVMYVEWAATVWHVDVDGFGVVSVEEWLLAPIDDGDETEHTERREEVEA